jgi:2-succinyl-6-hydroxy-2,4-cyclohexadiene-1-carboxylate synthase
MWDALIPRLESHFQAISIDLPGHGLAALPDKNLSLPEIGKSIAEFIDSEIRAPAILCGYSMGGRLALHTALYFPNTVKQLVLIGASPGIESERERLNRLESDRVLALNIRKRGIEWFTQYWESLPIFASQKKLPQLVQEKIRAERLNSNREALAYSLENWSTGAQNYLIPELHGLKCPVLLIAGALDKKFCESNRQMETVISTHARRVEIPNAGHAAHLENPDAVAEEILKLHLIRIDKI